MKKTLAAVIMILFLCDPINSQEMVEIAVEITEVNNTKALELGIKWPDSVQGGETSFSLSGRSPESLPEIPSIIDSGEWVRYDALSAELKFLQEKGAARILSKPKLIARSGTSARFVVGGEFPVTAEGSTTAKIEWKEYGIKTAVTPRILADGMIELNLSTEVSRLDWSNLVKGYPVINKREAESNIKIKSGQTISLAGMIETQKTEVRSGIPLLCDIPVLGYLFGRKKTVEAKLNVIIFVTPRILD